MANIIIEFYVSIDGLEYAKLDLHKDESINMKHTQKDLQNLSKIFAPYSQGFTFPASPKNRASFGFFGDTDVIKINTESKFFAKLYINGILNNTGFIVLSNLSYKNHKPEDFTGSFSTTMTKLKDRIGEDLLSDITNESVSILWSPEVVQNAVVSERTLVVNGIAVKYFAPLISINRVWSYENLVNGAVLDNIAYNPTSDLLGNNLIKPTELRPCISYSSIMDFIKRKYNLTVISPLEDREEYKDLRVWCNSEHLFNTSFNVLTINNAFGQLQWIPNPQEEAVPDPKKYTITANLQDNSFNVFKDPATSIYPAYENYFRFRILFSGVAVTSGEDAPSVDVQYINKSDGSILKVETFSLIGNEFNCDSKITDSLFGLSDNLEFYIKVRFNQPTSWASCSYRMTFRYITNTQSYFSGANATYYYDSLSNNNSSEVTASNIDLIKSLPNIKVIDFLNSHFKSFNISVFDTAPDNENLYWLTPQDIASSGEYYSKATLDYTPYLDSKKYNKEKPSDYNYYNFKHATSEYFSNKRYIEAFGLEYGQTVYPPVKPVDLKEFEVETSFSILPPISTSGATGLDSAYGFKDGDPEILDTGESRYEPNYDELTVFYTHGSTNCDPVGFLGLVTQSTGGYQYSSFIGVLAITSYIKVMPWNKNGYSFGFSILKKDNIEYINSLYSRYYLAQTIRLLDPNVLSQKLDLILPPDEIYLNDATTFQGSGNTPTGFRLQNDIIIGENLFSIVDATIDQTTGKTKMTLLNY